MKRGRFYIVGDWKNPLPHEGVLLVRKDGSLVVARNGDLFSDGILDEDSLNALRTHGLLHEVGVDLDWPSNEVESLKEHGVPRKYGNQHSLLEWLGV